MSAGIKFFQKAEVVDPDDASKIYCFDLDDPQHCACFNIGDLSLCCPSLLSALMPLLSDCKSQCSSDTFPCYRLATACKGRIVHFCCTISSHM